MIKETIIIAASALPIGNSAAGPGTQRSRNSSYDTGLPRPPVPDCNESSEGLNSKNLNIADFLLLF